MIIIHDANDQQRLKSPPSGRGNGSLASKRIPDDTPECGVPVGASFYMGRDHSRQNLVLCVELEMDKPFRNRLIEILLDRGLIGVLILLFGWQVNTSLERHKLVEAQRVADSSRFVAACSELWTKVYEYERLVNQSVELKTREWILSAIGKNDRGLRAEIAVQDKLIVARLAEFDEELAARRYIIGESMTAHFDRYMGLVLARAKAENDSRADTGEYAQKISRDAVEEFDKMLASMRFDATAAREHAISAIP
jgi:hypothetical protein